MKGQTTPSMASGRAMAKKASRARTNGMAAGHLPENRMGKVAALMLRKVPCSGAHEVMGSRHARRLRVGACRRGRVPDCPPDEYDTATGPGGRWGRDRPPGWGREKKAGVSSRTPPAPTAD